MNYCRVNGIDFDVTVAISNITESFNVLDGPNAGRVMTGRMVRDILGSYIGHNVTFMNVKNNRAFDDLWDYLVQHSVDDSVMVEMVDSNKSISYEAYYTSGSRTIRQIDRDTGTITWEEFSINFIPMEAQITP